LINNIRTCTRGIALLLALVICFSSCGKKSEDSQDDPESKKWKFSIVKYEELQQTEDAEKGLRAGLRDAGLVEGVNYDIYSRSAQGDITTLLNLVDAVNTDGTDLLISMQTTTLHTAVTRARNMPIVFDVVANPFVIANIGKSDKNHKPNVTGVYTMTTFEKMVEYIKLCVPNAKAIGTLFSTEEMNATYYKAQLQAAANAAGLELKTFGVGSPTDIPQATQALCSWDLDAICQIEDNLTSSRFAAIVSEARRYKLPVFSFVNSQINTGSSIVFAPDYLESSKSVGTMISSIMEGTSPGDIPFERITRFHLLVNLDNAREAGITIPDDIIKVADKVIGQK